jgi:hypothetical protein
MYYFAQKQMKKHMIEGKQVIVRQWKEVLWIISLHISLKLLCFPLCHSSLFCPPVI